MIKSNKLSPSYLKKNIILSFQQLSSKEVEIAGGKGASLGEMTKAGIPVPQGFVVLSPAFEIFLEKTDLNVEIDSILHSVNLKEIHTVEDAAEKIQTLIHQAEIPKELTREIISSFRKLNSKYVAVRSSATAEDSLKASWAGQLETYLNTTEKNLLKNIKKCWASLFSPRAIFYRFVKNLHKEKISVAVIVQKMINAEKSGVAFSVHPITQDKNQIIIEAGFGLGEAIVSGQITPDSYVVEKQPRVIIDKNIFPQRKGLYRCNSGGNKWRDIPKKQGEKQVLSDREILKLTEIILKIENHYGFPVDIEWAFEKGKFYILQSRPITTLQNNPLPIASEELIVARIRKNMPAPIYWNAAVLSSQSVKENYGKVFSVIYHFFYKGRFKSIVLKRQWNEIGEDVAEKLIKKKSFFKNLEKKANKAKQNIKSFLRSIKEKKLSKLSFKELINLTKKIYLLFKKYDTSTIYAWVIAGDFLKQKIKALLNISNDELDAVSLPAKPTTAKQMQLEVMEAALENKPLKKVAKKLAEKYYWIPFEYDGPIIWDHKYFIQKIKEYRKNLANIKQKYRKIIEQEKKLREKVKKIFKMKNFNKEERRLIGILQTITIWSDERKMLEFPLFFWYYNILKELSKRYGLSIVQLKYLLTDELKDLEKDRNKLKKIANERMSKEFMIVAKNEKVRVASQREISKIKKLIERQLQKSEIKGMVACKGPQKKYIARVKILHSSKECLKLKEDEILVATMTTPDYAPAMERALGFITDEGGVISHAAIVAREMNKPCIIGTGNATQILKDGDEVELDTTAGVVRILKRNK